MTRPRILFVCGRNKWRSPTAATVYRDDQRVEVRSAGISAKSARTRIPGGRGLVRFGPGDAMPGTISALAGGGGGSK